MRDWNTLEADVVKLVGKHFTPGRGGQKIQYVTRHHLAGIMTTEQTWAVWQDRQASAHYVVENSGRIGQLVWDGDTAWANANALSNQRSITIEHSNATGRLNGSDNFPSWQINDTVIDNGAHLAAAICRLYGLGRPVFGKNIRDHREFGQTSCPHHLAFGGRYHEQWMRRAEYWYDQMTKAPAPAPAPPKKDVLDMDRAELRKIIFECLETYLGPNNSDTKDVRAQLTGARDLVPGNLKASYPGWDLKQLVASAREKGFTGLTVTEMAALSVGGSEADLAAAREVAAKEGK